MSVRYRSAPLLICFALFIHGSISWADPPNDQKQKTDTPKVHEACGVSWHMTVSSALQQAATKKAEKPVMVLRVLGDLDGFM